MGITIQKIGGKKKKSRMLLGARNCMYTCRKNIQKMFKKYPGDILFIQTTKRSKYRERMELEPELKRLRIYFATKIGCGTYVKKEMSALCQAKVKRVGKAYPV